MSIRVTWFSQIKAHLIVDVKFATDQRLVKPFFDLTHSQVSQTRQSYRFGGIGSADLQGQLNFCEARVFVKSKNGFDKRWSVSNSTPTYYQVCYLIWENQVTLMSIFVQKVELTKPFLKFMNIPEMK